MSGPARRFSRGRLQVLALGAGLALAIGLVATGTAVEVSSRPAFCGSCHIMAPYYESWKDSSHANVACVDCHIPPGYTAEFRKKWEALSMVARYFTGTYGTNPWTEIDDAACLRCHERRLLSGKELFGDVLFDHSAHLSGMRRGKKLRCTSCHSQIVQGSHIAVTTSTCILCHFKGQESNTGIARCSMCHHVSGKEIRRGTLTFSHDDVARFGMDCTGCHARPEGSDGAVPRERCVVCHNEPARLAEFEEVDLLHRTHVSEHKVDCVNCHLEIEHVGEPRIEAAAGACSTCHSSGHSPQANLYAGIGGRGVPPMPDPMFAAGVRCEGCHLEIPGHDAGVRRASEVSCMSCHGPGYGKIFASWKEGVARRTAAVRRALDQTEPAIRGAAPAALGDARHNLELVMKARGVHNVAYSFALLEKAHEDINAARRDRGLPALPAPWTPSSAASPCLSCHQGIETQRGRIFGRDFAHEPHLAGAGLSCEACHRPHEERPKKEVVRFGPAGCESCHHGAARPDCLSCHAGVREKKLATALGEFDHAFHLDGAGLSCADCHELSPGAPVRLKEETCAGCHG